ncbi:MAG: phosphoglycerate kinase [Candidatus Margulisiibacteriota bacterium]
MKKKILALQNQSQVIFGTPTMDKLPSNAFADGITALRVALNVKVKNGKVTDPARLDNAVRDIVEIITKEGTPFVWGHIGRIGASDFIDLDSDDGTVIIDCLKEKLKKRGIELMYLSGVIDKDGIHPIEDGPSLEKGKAYLVNNIRVCPNYDKDGFATSFGELMGKIDAKIYICGAFADLASEGPERRDEFLRAFKHLAWAPSIVDEIQRMEDIKKNSNSIKVIQFAGSKLDKTDILKNLKNVLVPGGVIYVGSAIAAFLLKTDAGKEMLSELKKSFHILRSGDTPDCNAYNLAIPEVVNTPDGVYVKGKHLPNIYYPDITVNSTEWIIAEILSTLGPNDKMLLNGTPGFLEASTSEGKGFEENTKKLIEAIMDRLKEHSDASLTTVGGDGPASVKRYGNNTFTNIVYFTGGKVPLSYVTEGESGLPMVEALRKANEK